MGIELSLIRFLLTHNAKACKWQKPKIYLFYGGQTEVYVILDTNSMQVYKHGQCSDKGIFTSSNVCYSNNPCMNASILE